MGPDTADGTRLRRVLLLAAAAVVAVTLVLVIRVDRPPVSMVEADFVTRNGDWPTLEVDADPTVVPIGAPGAPAEVALPADGWELVVTAASETGDARSARYLAVGEVVWLVEEAGSMVIEGG
ncbi:MAG: hypothetical protein AB1Z57_11845 [Acidimicrobiia bacterium]